MPTLALSRRPPSSVRGINGDQDHDEENSWTSLKEQRSASQPAGHTVRQGDRSTATTILHIETIGVNTHSTLTPEITHTHTPLFNAPVEAKFRAIELANTGRVSSSEWWALCAHLAAVGDELDKMLLPVPVNSVSVVPRLLPEEGRLSFEPYNTRFISERRWGCCCSACGSFWCSPCCCCR